MRKIKFRAWYKDKMHGPLPLEEYLHIAEKVQRDLDATEKTIWMEFTGLYDKNGTEIYEGDVLRVINKEYCIQKSEFIGDVIMKDGAFGVRVQEVKRWEGFAVPPPEDNKIYWFHNLVYGGEFEVIGNIYEK